MHTPTTLLQHRARWILIWALSKGSSQGSLLPSSLHSTNYPTHGWAAEKHFTCKKQVWNWLAPEFITKPLNPRSSAACHPMNLPGSFVCGIPQARILEWVVVPFSRVSSLPRDRTHISCICRWVLYYWATWEALWLSQSFCAKHFFP